MGAYLRSQLLEVLRAIAPLVGTVCLLQVLLVHAPLPDFLQFLAGAAVAVLGMLLLFAGVEQGILPMGRYIGAELPRKGSMAWIVSVAAAMGFVTTVAEPDVLILATEVQRLGQGALPAWVLAALIALGVGLAVALAMWCIAHGHALTRPLAIAFLAMVLLTLAADPGAAALAFDAGSVTTGVLSGPVLMALGVGLSAVLARHPGRLDGFGLLGLASAGPVVLVLLLGWLR